MVEAVRRWGKQKGKASNVVERTRKKCQYGGLISEKEDLVRWYGRQEGTAGKVMR